VLVKGGVPGRDPAPCRTRTSENPLKPKFAKPPFWTTGRPRTDTPDKPLASRGRGRAITEKGPLTVGFLARGRSSRNTARCTRYAAGRFDRAHRAEARNPCPRARKWCFAGILRHRATARRRKSPFQDPDHRRRPLEDGPCAPGRGSGAAAPLPASGRARRGLGDAPTPPAVAPGMGARPGLIAR
jgi:hypothetical protein